PFEDLGDDRPVVRYDQLGGGKSSKITDTTMFTIPHFVAELDSLRRALGDDKVHLMGHSWGTILAVEYYLAHPEHVASLTLGSAALDIPAWSAMPGAWLPPCPIRIRRQSAPARRKDGSMPPTTRRRSMRSMVAMSGAIRSRRTSTASRARSMKASITTCRG